MTSFAKKNIGSKLFLVSIYCARHKHSRLNALKKLCLVHFIKNYYKIASLKKNQANFAYPSAINGDQKRTFDPIYLLAKLVV